MFNQRGLLEVPVPVSQTPQEGAAIHVHQLLKPGDGQGDAEKGQADGSWDLGYGWR